MEFQQTPRRYQPFTRPVTPKTQEKSEVFSAWPTTAPNSLDFSTITAPLHELTRKTLWQWGHEQVRALQKLSLTSDTTMSYFDPKKETELIVDGRPVGLGAILCPQMISYSGTRIVIPIALQQMASQLAHESHQCVAKTKALLREKVRFLSCMSG